MKQLTTVICCALFVLAGILAIGMEDRASPTELTFFPGNMTGYAQQSPNIGLPLDLQLDLVKRAQVDTVYIDTSRVDTVYKYKTKIRKVAVPEVVEIHDTLSVPVFYLATPLEHKVESIEIRVVDEVQIDSSSTNNHTRVLYEE